MKESDDYGIAKPNRRQNLEADKARESSHPFKFAIHKSSKKDIERRQHIADRKAAKRK